MNNVPDNTAIMANYWRSRAVNLEKDVTNLKVRLRRTEGWLVDANRRWEALRQEPGSAETTGHSPRA